MKRNGNITSNRTYNPQNKKPQIPLDVDEVDSALERFIRQKYDQQSFSSNAHRPAVRHDTGSTRSSDDQPPPLPPKPGKRFNFSLRSVSSALPLSRSNHTTPPTSPDEFGAPPSPIRVNKQSRVFGASVGGTNGEDMDAKLGTLRDMGFTDDRKNASILKGLGGNLERTIEALVRLGEGSAPNSRARTPAQTRNVAVSQPFPSVPETRNPAVTNGIQTSTNESSIPSQISSQTQSVDQGNPATQGQSSRSFSPASQGSGVSFHSSNPFQPRAYNPFETNNGPQSANYPLEKSFENMFVSQPLFPNATGGYPQAQHHTEDPRIQHSMTPPVPQMPQQHFQPMQHVQQPHGPSGHYNPFMQTPQPTVTVPPNQAASNPYAPLQQPHEGTSYNPFMSAQQSAIQSLTQEYAPQQQNSTLYQQQYQQTQQPSQDTYQQQAQIQQAPQSFATTPSNPYMTQNNQPNFQNYQHNQTYPQPLQPQQTGRIDKSSIMALYNYPQYTPPPLTNINESTVLQSPIQQEFQSSQYPTDGPPRQPQRSVTMPVMMNSGSRNPFQSATPASPGTFMAPAPSAHPPGPSRHMSQESVDIGGFQNGRHSPDAFASLSSRY